MTKLDINAYGVQELNHQEMVETEGGFLPLVVAAVVVVAALCTGCKNSYKVGSDDTIVVALPGSQVIVGDNNKQSNSDSSKTKK